MTSLTPISEASQSLNPDAFVSLYELDASNIGGPVLRWASCCESGGAFLRWNGEEYPPLDFTMEGFAWDGATPPRPKVSIFLADESKTVTSSFLSMVIGLNGGQGAYLTRIRTLARYLDGHEDGDHGICYPPDSYIVNSVTSLNKKGVQWELVTPLDLGHSMLPSRQALRNICSWRYRRWNAARGAFDYDQSTMACPYTGTACFTATGFVAQNSGDVCGKSLADCLLRYSGGVPLPFGGFPGLARPRA